MKLCLKEKRYSRNKILYAFISWKDISIDDYWKAPEPLPESDAVFEAKYLDASTTQVDYDGSHLKYFRQSEDCLYLNVCVVSKKKTKKSRLW